MASNLYGELTWRIDNATSLHVLTLGALCLSMMATRTRWANGIPTIHPRTEASLLGLGSYAHRGRSWTDSTDSECDRCLRLLFGPAATTPRA